MVHILVQKEEISFLKDQLIAAVDDMRGGSGAHIDHLHVVVAMLWKICKSGMRTDLDEAAFFQQKTAVNDEISPICISFLPDLPASVQQFLFLRCDSFKHIKKFPAHDFPPFFP